MGGTRRILPRLIGVALVGALLASACGSPSASPSPSAEPTPTPPTADLAEVFADALLDPAFTATADVSGAFTADVIEGEISGSAEFVGRDTFQELTISLPTGDTTSATLAVDGEAYARTGDGPWIQQGAAQSESTLQGQFVELLANLEDEGTEEVNGRELHHLVPAEPVELSAAAFGLTDPSITDFAGTVDFYATETGEPAVLGFTLTWTQAGLDFEMLIQYDLDMSATPTLAAPDDPWAQFRSDRFSYGLAYPESWVLEELDGEADSPAHDLFYSLAGASELDGEIQIYFYDAAAVSTLTDTEWFTASSGFLTDNFGVEVEATEPITVGGLSARYFSLHYSAEGESIFFQEAVVFSAEMAWDVDWHSTAGNEATDRASFDTFLATFATGG